MTTIEWNMDLQKRIAFWEASDKATLNGYLQVTHWTDLVYWTDEDMTQDQIMTILGINLPSINQVRGHIVGAWESNERLKYVAYKSLLKSLELKVS